MVRGYLFRLSLGFGSRRSLAARGQFLNTFAGLGFWVAFSLLALGGYLIEQQFENPIQAQSAGLLLAAPLITAATTLFYLLYSSRKLRRHVPVWPVPDSWQEKTNVARRNTGARIDDGASLPLHGRFIDRAVIRIQR